MQLNVSADEDEIYLFERVVVHLQSRFQYSAEDAVQLVNDYYANFTSAIFCERFNIPVQNTDLFCNWEARAMADRVHYYQGLGNTPDEQAFIAWQRQAWAEQMISKVLAKIGEPGVANLDLLIDELNDYVERGPVRTADAERVVDRVAELLNTEIDPDVWESVFNLLGSVSGDEVLRKKIVDIAVKYLPTLSTACLAHAIPLIAESDRHDKRGLISPFLESPNVAVRSIAAKYIGTS